MSNVIMKKEKKETNNFDYLLSETIKKLKIFKNHKIIKKKRSLPKDAYIDFNFIDNNANL